MNVLRTILVTTLSSAQTLLGLISVDVVLAMNSVDGQTVLVSRCVLYNICRGCTDVCTAPGCIGQV